MAGYQRRTALSPREALQQADRILPRILGLTKSKESGHSATFTGKEGTVTLTAHRHGPYTELVASTDGLRTSRIDHEVQRFLSRLPYEPGDTAGSDTAGAAGP